MEPQPTQEVIVKCHRYYTKLKSYPTYQKRVTILSTYEKTTSNETIALVEYQGIYKNQKTTTWNNTKTEEPYIRTDPEILREATITTSKHQMPIKTSHQMLLNNSVSAPNAKKWRKSIQGVEKGPKQFQSQQHRGRGAIHHLYVPNRREQHPGSDSEPL